MPHIVRVLAVLILTLSLSPWGAAAHADPPAAVPEPPVAVSGPVTDRAGVLGGRRAEVEAAIARLRVRHGIRLYVVYVRSFSGMGATDWAAGTARLSGLGRLDLLLAVATGEGRYAVCADPAFPLSGAQLDSVAATAIEPGLRHSDWAGAPIVAAREYDAVLASAGTVSAWNGPAHGLRRGPAVQIPDRLWG
ncbi:TPM domain-containing protein [Streptosporangium roseum]|uniref:TPM domain-containing protein n=1 Tax=Streptosporangium roseum TaxID=2001 RepID=UPI0033329E1E